MRNSQVIISTYAVRYLCHPFSRSNYTIQQCESLLYYDIINLKLVKAELSAFAADGALIESGIISALHLMQLRCCRCSPTRHCIQLNTVRYERVRDGSTTYDSNSEC